MRLSGPARLSGCRARLFDSPRSAPGRPPPRAPRPRSPGQRQAPPAAQELRAFLWRASCHADRADELHRLLGAKLSASAAEELRPVVEAASGGGPDAQQLAELEAGLERMLQLFSAGEVVRLLRSQPGLLQSRLVSWFDFLGGYGFSTTQIKNLIAEAPEVLAQGDVYSAGRAIRHLAELGFDDDEVRHRVVAYCPGVLNMDEASIDVLIRLWSKFKVGVDEQGGSAGM